MLSKGANRWILDDITRFSKYIWQMTFARSEDINKDDISILNLLKITFSFCIHFGTVLTEEIRIANFVSKCLWCRNIWWPNLIYLNYSYTCLHSVKSFYRNNIAELLWYGKLLFFLLLYLTWGVVQSELGKNKRCGVDFLMAHLLHFYIHTRQWPAQGRGNFNIAFVWFQLFRAAIQKLQ